jgi:hypothetical protein
MIKYITILILSFSVGCSFADDISRVFVNFMPDGTEIKIQDNMVYAVCDGKFQIVSDGSYELADGSIIIVKKGELANFNRVRKWLTPNEENTNS